MCWRSEGLGGKLNLFVLILLDHFIVVKMDFKLVHLELAVLVQKNASRFFLALTERSLAIQDGNGEKHKERVRDRDPRPPQEEEDGWVDRTYLIPIPNATVATITFNLLLSHLL